MKFHLVQNLMLHIYGNWEIEKAIEAALTHIESALVLQPDSSSALAVKGMLLSEKAFYEATINDNNDTDREVTTKMLLVCPIPTEFRGGVYPLSVGKSSIILC